MSLENFYNEHVTQARQHEDQREKATGLILAITSALIGLITFSELTLPSLPASLTIMLLGVYGFLFVGKHYERFRYHTRFVTKSID